MIIVKDHELAIGEALNVSLDSPGANRGRGVEGGTSILGIVTAGAPVGTNLLVGKSRCCQLNAHR